MLQAICRCRDEGGVREGLCEKQKKQGVGGCCYRDYVHHSNEQEKKRNEKER